MVEIKRRISTIKRIIEGNFTTGFLATDYEFVCLQLRKILELIAFSSLVCNKDIYSQTYVDFSNHWRMADILKKLEKLNPSFYPDPIIIIPGTKPNSVDEFISRPSGFLTKADFLEVYNECSQHIHTNNPFSVEPDIELLKDRFFVWVNKIINLINPHLIKLVDDSIMYYISMGSEEPDTVTATIFSKNV